MESHLSQESLGGLILQSDISEPSTPELSHSSISDSTTALHRLDNAPSSAMTPPPSTQVPPSSRPKTRTPTPPISHISTPPPTVEVTTNTHRSRFGAGPVEAMTLDELDAASSDDLKEKILRLQAALREAQMLAAHHRLQYQMLSQESAAAMDRMAVEARMAQEENKIIQDHAEQARLAATPVQQSPVQTGTIPVEKGLYQRMVREIQLSGEDNAALRVEIAHRDAMIDRQDNEIATLTDKVTMMRERIRGSREQLHKYRRQQASPRVDATPRSVYSTPQRSHLMSQRQTQPFAALLQASEMASQESARAAPVRGMAAKRGHARNTHSMSSLPSTPQRMQNMPQPTFLTPSGRQPPLKVPSTAPMPRTSGMRPLEVYAQSALPVPRGSAPAAPQSEGTVSADEDDSEAETDIIEQDDEIGESHASRAASQMLRSSQEQEAKRNSFKGSGMLEGLGGGERLKQTKLFGAVRKANVDRDDEPPAKRARMGEPAAALGLGISGVRD